MSSIVLFDDKKDCCGCGACMNVCPKNAIRMAEDEVGFVYPEIDQNLCVGWKSTKLGLIFSVSIEMLQLLLRLGTFQVSDIVYNTLGGMLGGLCYIVGKKVHERLSKYSQPQILFNFPKPPSPRTCLIRKACIIQVQRKKRLVLEQSGNGDTER